MLRRSVCLFLLTIVSVAGCSTYRAPVIRVGDASLSEVAEEALSVDVAIDLENPNPEPLELRSITYTVSIDGRPIYAGKRAAEATLAGAAIKTISLPAVVRYDRVDWDGAMPPAEAAWSVSGKVLYVRPGELGEILLDAQLIKPMAAFGGGGTVDLTR